MPTSDVRVDVMSPIFMSRHISCGLASSQSSGSCPCAQHFYTRTTVRQAKVYVVVQDVPEKIIYNQIIISFLTAVPIMEDEVCEAIFRLLLLDPLLLVRIVIVLFSPASSWH